MATRKRKTQIEKILDQSVKDDTRGLIRRDVDVKHPEAVEMAAELLSRGYSKSNAIFAITRAHKLSQVKAKEIVANISALAVASAPEVAAEILARVSMSHDENLRLIDEAIAKSKRISDRNSMIKLRVQATKDFADLLPKTQHVYVQAEDVTDENKVRGIILDVYNTDIASDDSEDDVK